MDTGGEEKGVTRLSLLLRIWVSAIVRAFPLTGEGGAAAGGDG